MAKSQGNKGFSKKARGGFLVLGALGFCGYLLFGRPLGFSSSEEQVLFEVPKNASISSLARDLHEKGLIGFPRIFKLVVRLTGQEKRIRAGFYYIQPRNSVVEMAFKLSSGKMATHTVTIPEGKTSWEIYGILKRYFSLDSLSFAGLVHDSEFARSMGMETHGVEGYLFPDTYILPWRITEADVLRTMITRFQQVAGEFPEDSQSLKATNPHGWVTLASIVEKEAAVSSEKKLIAGVFSNRLRLGWPLGADPTTRFAMKKLTGPISAADLNTNSPYNTRRFAGLPPGPVCNPGREALLAALHPKKTPMMFFVAKDDGSRQHYFSATNEEHNGFKAQAAANRRHRAEAHDSISLSEAIPQDSAIPLPQNERVSLQPGLTNTRISEKQ